MKIGQREECCPIFCHLLCLLHPRAESASKPACADNQDSSDQRCETERTHVCKYNVHQADDHAQDEFVKKGERLRVLVVGPAVCRLKQSAQVIDLSGMIEVVGDQDADDVARGKSFSPIGESVFFQFRVVGQSADGG